MTNLPQKYVDDKTPVIVAPLGGGADDWNHIFGSGGIAANAAAQGKILLFTDGYYVCGTVQNVPSNSHIELSSGVIIHSTLANTGVGGFTNSVFFATLSNAGSGNNLTSSAIIGTNIINVTSAVAIGSTIAIRSAAAGNQQQQATVIATSNGGLTLTLDEEILYNYFTTGASSFIYTYTPPHDIIINGNGCRVYGTGDRVCEFAFARNVRVDGIIVDHLLGNKVDGFLNILFSMDVGCRDSGYSNCRSDGGVGILSGVVGLNGFALESGNRNWLQQCLAENFPSSNGVGFAVYDGHNGVIESCTARNCRAGFFIASNDSFGTDGARGYSLTDIHSNACVFGIYIDMASRVHIKGWTDTGSPTSLLLGAGSTGNYVFIDGFLWVAPRTGTYNGFTAATGDLMLNHGVIDMTSTSGTKAVCDWGAGSPGTLRLQDIKTISGTYGLYLEDGVVQNVIIGSGVDLSSCGTQIHRGTLSVVTSLQLSNNGTAIVESPFLSGLSTRSWHDSNDADTLDFILNSTGTTAIQFANTVTQPLIKQADRTTNSGVGTSFMIQAQNETGTSSTGGKLVLGSGTGTSANGVVQFNSGTTTLGSFSLNSTTDWRMTLDSGLTNMVLQANGPSHTMVLQALDGSGSINIQAPTVVYYDNIPTEAFRFNLSSNGSTSLVVNGSVTSFNINYNQMGGTGSNNGGTTNINAQAGQNQSGANNNNPGGDVVISGGSAGTGGSGSAGADGGVTFFSGITQVARLEVSNIGFGAINYLNLGVSGGIRASNIVSAATSGDAYYIASGHVYLGTITDPTAWGFSSAGLAIEPTQTATISQTVVSSTGSNSGLALTITSQAGQAQTGSNNNNNGGNLILGTGAAGTGGSGLAGSPGSIVQKLGGQTVLTMSSVGGAGITTLLDASQNFSIFQGSSSQSWYFISGVVNFESSTTTMYDFSVNKVFDFNNNGAGASNFTVAAPVTYTFTQAQKAGTGATAGLPLTIQAQQGQAQTGATANNNGGNLLLTSGKAGTGGSGTAAIPGSINITCGTQPLGAFQSLGPGDARFTVDGGTPLFVFAANQPGQGVYFQAVGSGGQINFQTGQVIFYDGSVSQTLQLILASGGATSLTISSTVTGFTLGYADNTVNSATASPLVLFAQNATGTGATGGDVDIGSGKGTSTHGKIGLYVGGAGAVSPALFELKTTSATMKLNSVTILSFDTSTGIMAIGDNVDTAHVDLFAGGSVRTWTNSVNSMAISDISMALGVATVAFTSSVAAPKINQSSISTTNGTGQALTIQGQNETGSGGSTVGGALNLTGGTGNTNGKVQLQDGGTTIATVGGSTMTMASGVFCQKTNVTNSATGSISIDMSTGNIQEINMTGNITTLAFTNLKTGAYYTLAFIQDAGTGSHTLSLPAVMHVAGATFTLTSNKGIRDNITLYYDGSVLHEICRAMNITN